MTGRLIVISNRVAKPREKRAGGLATAMLAALREHGGIWFGWSGNHNARSGKRTLHDDTVDDIRFVRLDLTREEYKSYYLGFANRTLWPLLHFQGPIMHYRRSDYEGYRHVNRLFATHLAPLIKPSDTLWVQDYHLIPLAWELRKLGIANRIGFFLHIPVPPPEMLHILPCHDDLLATLSAYDLVGVQTADDARSLARHFTDTVGSPSATLQIVPLPRIRTFPISIDTQAVAAQAARAASNKAVQDLHRQMGGRPLVIGVDRLDYSKGLPRRFEAFAGFLKVHPEWQSAVSFLQIAPPTRQDVPEYKELRNRLEQLAGATNGRYAEPDWVPIHYVNRSYALSTLSGLYRLARLGFVTPLRDGMNLVAKEFVASQPAEQPGVLVLSKFAGAAHELDTALQVNPFDADDLIEALESGLSMRRAERQERWRAMFDYLLAHDINHWRESFLETLAGMPSR